MLAKFILNASVATVSNWQCKGTKNSEAKQAFSEFIFDLFQMLKFGGLGYHLPPIAMRCRSAALPRREKTAYRGVGCLVNLRLFEPNVDKNMIIWKYYLKYLEISTKISTFVPKEL